MFTVGALLAGAVAAYIVGLSKTGIPGGGLLAIPLFATVFEGSAPRHGCTSSST